MDAIIKLIVDNGIGIVCVGYLIWFQSTVMRSMQDTLNAICNRLTAIETKLDGKDGDGN